MTKTDWWETFTKTGCVTDYLSYKGVGKEEYSCVQPKNRNDSSITIEVTEKNEKVFVSVKDTGMGIPKKELNKIWERFYKSDLSRGKDKKGTGLGLAIVKEAIQAHDEHINVISTEGVGTEFIFSLTKV